MAQKSREDLTTLVDQKVYDNTQKEILASMMREVLLDYRDSHFNWISDQLKTAMYNQTQTLEQYLNAIAGSVPQRGRVVNIDIGNNGRPENIDLASSTELPNNIITSAKYINRGPYVCGVEMELSINIGNKAVIPVIRANNRNNSDAQNTLCAPVVIIDSTTKVYIALREVKGVAQNIDIEIIVI